MLGWENYERGHKDSMSKSIGTKKKSIRSKIVVLVVLLAVIITGISGFCSYNQSNNNMTEEERGKEAALLDISGDYIDNMLAGYENQLNGLAVSDIMTDVANPNVPKTQVDSYLSKYLKTIPSGLNLYIATTDGRVYYCLNQTLPSGYNPKEKEWYKKAESDGGETIWTDFYKDALTSKNTITAAKQLKDGAGNVIGVAALDMDLTALSKSITSIKIGDNGYIFLADNNGRMIAHSDASRMGTNIDKYDWGKKIINGDKGSIDYNFDGTDKYSTFKTIDKLGWKIVATLPVSEITAASAGLVKNSLILGIVSILIGLAAAILISKSITDPIAKIEKMLSNIKSGDNYDLSNKIMIESNDELGRLSSYINNSFDGVRELIIGTQKTSGKVKHEIDTLSASVSQTSAATEEIAKAVQDVASGASAQATDVQEISGVVDDLSKSISEVKEAADQVSTMSNDSLLLSQEGKKIVDTLVERNAESVKASENEIKAINELNDRSKQIGDIVGTINAIADQTNLLALNAAIEAARAGEAGRGFAVVADEIRKLAEQSSQAVLQVQDLIGGIEKNVSDSVESASKTGEINKELTESVKSTSEAFSMITNSLQTAMESIDKVKGMMDEMNKLREKAVEGTDSISAVAEETAASTQEVSASAEEQSAALEEIKDALEKQKAMTASLFKGISYFKV